MANKMLTPDQRLAVLEQQVKALNDQVTAYLEQRQPPSFIEHLKGVPISTKEIQQQSSFIETLRPTLIDI